MTSPEGSLAADKCLELLPLHWTRYSTREGPGPGYRACGGASASFTTHNPEL